MGNSCEINEVRSNHIKNYASEVKCHKNEIILF